MKGRVAKLISEGTYHVKASKKNSDSLNSIRKWMAKQHNLKNVGDKKLTRGRIQALNAVNFAWNMEEVNNKKMKFDAAKLKK